MSRRSEIFFHWPHRVTTANQAICSRVSISQCKGSHFFVSLFHERRSERNHPAVGEGLLLHRGAAQDRIHLSGAPAQGIRAEFHRGGRGGAPHRGRQRGDHRGLRPGPRGRRRPGARLGAGRLPVQGHPGDHDPVPPGHVLAGAAVEEPVRRHPADAAAGGARAGLPGVHHREGVPSDRHAPFPEGPFQAVASVPAAAQRTGILGGRAGAGKHLFRARGEERGQPPHPEGETVHRRALHGGRPSGGPGRHGGHEPVGLQPLLQAPHRPDALGLPD